MKPEAESAIEDARRAGFDIDLIESNLAISPEERWRQHQLALDMVLELKKARIAPDSQPRSADRLLHRLADSGLDFVVAGGFAAVAHGSWLLTRELEICAVLTDENVEKLRTILADWHPQHRKTPQRLSFLEFPKSGPLQNLFLETDYGVVDILTSVLGVGDFQRLKRHAEIFEIGGRRYQVMSLADLITAKEALGREKDLLAAKELRAMAEKDQRE